MEVVASIENGFLITNDARFAKVGDKIFLNDYGRCFENTDKFIPYKRIITKIEGEIAYFDRKISVREETIFDSSITKHLKISEISLVTPIKLKISKESYEVKPDGRKVYQIYRDDKGEIKIGYLVNLTEEWQKLNPSAEFISIAQHYEDSFAGRFLIDLEKEEQDLIYY